MLNILQRIIQEVHTATNLEEALDISVRRIKEYMQVDSCSVLVADTADGSYVLMATEGLNPAAIGKVRLEEGEGLVGLVAERQEPISVPNAADHPRYRYFPETGEERFHAFMGVPIIYYRRVLGVLVVYHRERRLFTKDEEALLVTIAAQLAGAINDGTMGGGISRLRGGRLPPNTLIKGIPGAPGVAVGTVVLPFPFTSLNTVPDRTVKDSVAEEANFRAAVAAVQEELRAGSERLAKLIPVEARSVFDVYIMLLGNERLVSDTVRRIRGGNWAPGALRDTIAEYAHLFEQMEDSYLCARAEDIRGIGRRILLRLQTSSYQPKKYPERCVLVGEEISAATLVEVPVERLAGIVCTRGSVLSHTAILARALGIPAVMGVGELPIGRLEGARIVVDGYQGHVFLQPTSAVLTEFRRLVSAEEDLAAELEDLRGLPAETVDGFCLPLYANSGLLSDIRASLERGAEGIGLYRTEFTFMLYDAFPSEDEQYQIYRQVLETFAPRPVVMRTVDTGGDKSLPYFPVSEDNPLLGWRGIRVSLDHPEIFLTQLKAMLRANAGLGNLQILLPMISGPDEVDQARELLNRACQDLFEQGQPAAKPPLGAVIEVPATLYQVSMLAQRVDFFSIGSNDLTQYFLAANRNNPRVSTLCDSLNPAVLQAIDAFIQKAHHYQRPVGICGEMAGDPLAVILLIGMGIDSLSVASPNLLRVKWVIRTLYQRDARNILNDVLGFANAAQVRERLNQIIEKAGLGALVRAGK